jgi:hypothetical protein
MSTRAEDEPRPWENPAKGRRRLRFGFRVLVPAWVEAWFVDLRRRIGLDSATGPEPKTTNVD